MTRREFSILPALNFNVQYKVNFNLQNTVVTLGTAKISDGLLKMTNLNEISGKSFNAQNYLQAQ